MKKPAIVLSTAILLGFAGAAHAADVGKAASDATNAAQHKIDQKRAESKAKESGPVGKVVNDAKAGYHKNRSDAAADNAKKAISK